MAEPGPASPDLAPRGSVASVRCEVCGNDVPVLEHCVRCGNPLAMAAAVASSATGRIARITSRARRRESFAAAPSEPLLTLGVSAALFPHLPRSNVEPFRWSLVIGAMAIVGLAAAGYFPVAFLVAALLVPLVLVIYIYAVDVYEDQPLLVVVLTLAWGAAAGLVVGLVARFLAPAGGEPATFADELIVRGVVLPLVGGIVAALGPVALLVYPKFNDVLDGVTFGAAAGATFGAGQAIGNGIDLLSGGLRPTGETGAWIERLLALGILAPVLWSAVVGAVMAAFWLRYRAPIRDQASLGVLGRPLIAAIAGGLVLVLASSGQVVLGRFAALGWLALLAALAILWLRVTIHLGLLQEAAEIEIGDPVTCANCARTTPHHTFCGRCGIALRALPKGRTSRRDARGADPGDAR